MDRPRLRAGRHWSSFSIPADGDGFSDRMEICLRAQLLDEVIDPLADFVEARVVPDRKAEVQAAKRAAHEAAMEAYRKIYRTLDCSPCSTSERSQREQPTVAVQVGLACQPGPRHEKHKPCRTVVGQARP